MPHQLHLTAGGRKVEVSVARYRFEVVAVEEEHHGLRLIETGEAFVHP
jgi:hypothetical protein